jgi:hypothetical protein
MMYNDHAGSRWTTVPHAHKNLEVYVFVQKNIEFGTDV